MTEQELSSKDIGKSFLAVWTILGTITIEQHHFLCVVTEKQISATYKGIEINEISMVKLIPYNAANNVQLDPSIAIYV